MRYQVVVVNYGLGNQASVQRVIRNLGHRCVITDDINQIAQADLVILPGVGAFPEAMKMLHSKHLINVLSERARLDRPILGICLGMQLLVESSEELGLTKGLGLIPGHIKLLKGQRWHIGWNTLEVEKDCHMLQSSNGHHFYFNHSYAYEGPEEYVEAVANNDQLIPAMIRLGKVAGVQFHPEKSQEAGRLLLGNLINSLVDGLV